MYCNACGVLSPRLSCWLLLMNTVLCSVVFCGVTPLIFFVSGPNDIKFTGWMFLVTVQNGWVLNGSLLLPVPQHGDFVHVTVFSVTICLRWMRPLVINFVQFCLLAYLFCQWNKFWNCRNSAKLRQKYSDTFLWTTCTTFWRAQCFVVNDVGFLHS